MPREGFWLQWAAWSAAILVFGLFAAIFGDVLFQGTSHLNWSFLFSVPEQSGRGGGIGPILISTAGILWVCLSLAIPLGVATAMLLSEFAVENPRLGRWVRQSLDVLAGVPSIVFGLFGNALFCRFFGLGVSILSGGLTLALMILPFLIRASEEGFRAISVTQRQSAAALGFTKSGMLFRILLPMAAPGVMAGVVLGLGRATAETAALLFTSGYVPRTPSSLLDSGRMLSVHIYDLAMNIPGGNNAAYASALVLVGLLFAIHMLSQTLMHIWLGRHLKTR